jgi:hypothetical protein
MSDPSEFDTSVMKAQVKQDAAESGQEAVASLSRYDIGYNDYEANETVPIRVETVRQIRKHLNEDPIAHAFVDVAVSYHDDPRIVLGALKELSKRVAPILGVDDTFSIIIKKFVPEGEESKPNNSEPTQEA